MLKTAILFSTPKGDENNLSQFLGRPLT